MGKTRNEAKNEWNKKVYCRYILSLRKDRDKELIAQVEQLKKNGLTTTEVFRELINENSHAQD